VRDGLWETGHRRRQGKGYQTSQTVVTKLIFTEILFSVLWSTSSANNRSPSLTIGDRASLFPGVTWHSTYVSLFDGSCRWVKSNQSSLSSCVSLFDESLFLVWVSIYGQSTTSLNMRWSLCNVSLAGLCKGNQLYVSTCVGPFVGSLWCVSLRGINHQFQREGLGSVAPPVLHVNSINTSIRYMPHICVLYMCYICDVTCAMCVVCLYISV